MATLEERKDICPVCLQRIEPHDDVIEVGERDVHAPCYEEETVAAGTTILSEPKPISTSPEAAPKKRH